MDSTRWWNDETVAVVTGGNKGIGLEVCKQLADKGSTVVLTARDERRGSDAFLALRKQGLHNLHFHPLDVTDVHSIAVFASWISQKFGGLDILVNNAAVSGVVVDEHYVNKNKVDLADLMFKQETSEGFIIEYKSAKACIDANYYGAKHVTEALIPLLRPSSQGARIINVGSDYGQLSHLQSTKLQQELANLDNLSEAFIDKLLDTYLSDVKCQSLEGKGWPLKFPSYKMSKVALHAYTRVLAREVEKKLSPTSGRVFVNCVHPGYVRTDLTSLTGELSSQQGAANVVKIALLPPENSPSGQFFYEGNLATF
ncbi:hypothetical protein GOP47_0021966 [Adiantum capillus-veneris]|uniref:Uncharacterized protein n=1 Tax=Adiantum capillus-veneris TaxID=13818 RepID=A0A9D4UA66_ADICA|nr:hypothetical protein GOP47_0021966 [Adiantum capillus-veneris]